MMSQRQRVGGGSLFERKLTESSPFRQGEQGFGWIERNCKKIQEYGNTKIEVGRGRIMPSGLWIRTREMP